jgi:hypothetical protein
MNPIHSKLPSSRSLLVSTLSILCAVVATCERGAAQAIIDSNTLLFLAFDNSLAGAAGELPASAIGIGFTSGLSGAAATFPAGNILTYAASGNIDSSNGTLEFLVNPTWNGNDAAHHTFLTWGGAGGAVFQKDSANNLRGIFNRFGPGGTGEFGVPSFSIGSWVAGEWHGLAYTWNDSTKSLKLYIDGTLASSGTYSGTLPPIAAADFQIGGEGPAASLGGSLDSFRISSVERTPAEIAQYYQAVVPEPATALLLSLSGLAFCAARPRKRSRL